MVKQQLAKLSLHITVYCMQLKNFILICVIFLTLLSYRSYECWVEGKWTFSDPWGYGYPEASVKPPSALSSFSVTQIVHGTHKEDCESILQAGFKACQLKIDSQHNKFTWSGERGEQPRRQRDQTPHLPGYYVWFAPEVTLTKAQRATCWKMIKENEVAQFADYIEGNSRYGSQGFSLSLSDAVLLYEHSLKKYYEKSGKPVSNPEIVFKKAGTKRYQLYVGYILVICAKVDGWDPLPQFPNIKPSVHNGPITVFNTSELRFRPKGIAIEENDGWCSWDALEFAFHFPSLTQHSDPCPILFTRSQNNNPRPYSHQRHINIKLTDSHTGTMFLSPISHTFCARDKECPEKTDEELEEHQEKRFQWP